MMLMLNAGCVIFFFFQAEDGIRDLTVTGVQTCALPIYVNGRGTLLTTEECLLSKVQERNPGFTKEDYAQVFREYFGVTNVLWLKNGIAGDDTHGHVDDLARFVNPATVVTILENDPKDPNYAALQENLALLKIGR